MARYNIYHEFRAMTNISCGGQVEDNDMLGYLFGRNAGQERSGFWSGNRGLMAIVLCLLLSLSLITGCGAGKDPSSSKPSSEGASLQTEGASLQTEEASGQELSFSMDETDSAEASDPDQSSQAAAAQIDEDGSYDQKDDVALYIHTYGHLPSNYITKKEAKALGWEGGSLERYAPGKCIGGSYFGNYEGLLPQKKGRSYYECDIDTLGRSKRGAKRIIYSTDGLIYYTEDHYESFELLYGEE